ncbi:unnamed protein product [Prorocentrum cordatum]|uniref:Uncharacterized protein n=1 Tax=Prorocentrum cordatum TaxID=2364126 RepID=A0ABN9WNA0_9DINO|nr:unnamed protein product [Polarella glacialis]
MPGTGCRNRRGTPKPGARHTVAAPFFGAAIRNNPPPMELSPLLLGLKSAPAVSPSRHRLSAPELGAPSQRAFENGASSDEVFMLSADAEAARLSDDSFLAYADAEAIRLKTPQLTPRGAPEIAQPRGTSMLREGLDGQTCQAEVPQPAHVADESLLLPGLKKYRPLGPPTLGRVTRCHSARTGNGSQMTGVYSMGTPTTACPSDQPF